MLTTDKLDTPGHAKVCHHKSALQLFMTTIATGGTGLSVTFVSLSLCLSVL